MDSKSVFIFSLAFIVVEELTILSFNKQKLQIYPEPLLPPGVNFINIFTRSFFKAFLSTANCDLRMATSTPKCALRMAQPAQFLYEKV